MRIRSFTSLWLSALLIGQTALPAFARTNEKRLPLRSFPVPHPRLMVKASPVLALSKAPLVTNINAPGWPLVAVTHELSENPVMTPVGSENNTTEVYVEASHGAVIWNPMRRLEVPNDLGPSASFSPSFYEGSQPIDNGFGPRFSHPYNYGWDVRLGGSQGNLPAYPKFFDLVMPNGSKVAFENPTTSFQPTVGTEIPLTRMDGWSHSFAAAWWGLNSQYQQYIRLVNKDGSQMTFEYSYPMEEGFHNMTGETVFRPTKIEDKVGNFITLEYAAEARPVKVYIVEGQSDYWMDVNLTVRNLKVVRNAQGVALLTLGTNGQGSYTNAVDNFGRKVMYNVERHDWSDHFEHVYLSSYDLRSVSILGNASDTALPAAQTFDYVERTAPGTGYHYLAVQNIGHPNPAGNISNMVVSYDSDGRVDPLMILWTTEPRLFMGWEQRRSRIFLRP